MAKLTSITIATLVAFTSFSAIGAQSEANCGDIIEAEIGVQEANEGHFYQFMINAGDQVSIEVRPVSSSSDPIIRIFDAGGDEAIEADSEYRGIPEAISNFVMPSSGANQIQVRDFTRRPMAYILSIECVLRTGEQITTSATELSVPVMNVESSSQVESSLTGFPGLPPVDFANGISVPLNLAIVNNGAISPGFESVFGFTFEGEAGNAVALTVNRETGNLNLGLAVLSSDNQIVFFGTLVSSKILITDFELPSTGQYTIGIFLLDLIPPATPESTSFTVQASISTQ